jgi:cell division protein FtsZ
LLEDVSIKGARGLLINVTGGPDMSLYEVNEAASLIQEEAHEDANIIFGAVIDEKINDEIHVTVIATGFGDHERHMAITPAGRYSPSGTQVTAPVQAAMTRPLDQYQPQNVTSMPAAPPPPPPQSNTFGARPVRRLGMIVDDGSLDVPAYKRRQNVPSAASALDPSGPTRLQGETMEGDDKLDIPAFLRKQLD